MAGTFILGETKVRPGTYFNIQKKGGNAAAGVMNGVTAVIFRADFGPLNEAIELSAEDGYEGTFGTALTTDAMRQSLAAQRRSSPAESVTAALRVVSSCRTATARMQ